MSNPLFNGEKSAQQSQMNPQQAISQIKSDPVGFLKQSGYNIPAEIAKNPAAIIQHLVNSGQIPKSRLQMYARR
jgi:hypothetical protein